MNFFTSGLFESSLIVLERVINVRGTKINKLDVRMKPRHISMSYILLFVIGAGYLILIEKQI